MNSIFIICFESILLFILMIHLIVFSSLLIYISVLGSPLPWGFTLPNRWIKCFRVTTPMGFHFSLTSEMSSINPLFLCIIFAFILPIIVNDSNLISISNCSIECYNNPFITINYSFNDYKFFLLQFLCCIVNFVYLCVYYTTWLYSTTSFVLIINQFIIKL